MELPGYPKEKQKHGHWVSTNLTSNSDSSVGDTQFYISP